jgi:hypothetical protein
MISAKLSGRRKTAAEAAAERRIKSRRFIAVNSTTRCAWGQRKWTGSELEFLTRGRPRERKTLAISGLSVIRPE